MILTCPACGTQYVVKDGAIPPSGRQVRCASCRHGWHQGPEAPDDPSPTLVLTEAQEQFDDPLRADTPQLGSEEQATGPADDDPAADLDREQAVADGPASTTGVVSVQDDDHADAPRGERNDQVGDDFTPFAAHDGEPKRRGAGFKLLVAIALIVIAAITFWYLAPAAWKDRVGLGDQRATPLQLMMTHSDRQRLASGNELLAISGRVINPTQTKQTVPPITAQLRDTKGKLVYSWTIAPPAPSLKGGDSASFYSAEVNVPAGGDELTVTLGASKKAG